MTKLSEGSNFECGAKPDSPKCQACVYLAKQAISTTLEQTNMSTEDQDVLAVAILPQLEAFVDTTFPASMVDSGLLSCGDRRKIVEETAVGFTNSRSPK